MDTTTLVKEELHRIAFKVPEKGTFFSPKMQTQVPYVTRQEFAYTLLLEASPAIKNYWYECLRIRYIDHGRMRIYCPDDLIQLYNDEYGIRECKGSEHAANTTNTRIKAIAANIYCYDKGYTAGYEIVTWRNMIEDIKRLECRGIEIAR
jgi:hypothetical protein